MEIQGGGFMRQIIRKGILGERVRDYAAAKGIPISALERDSGFSAGMVSRWIAAGNEDYNVLSKLVNLSDLLGVSLDELIGRQAGDLFAVTVNSPIPQLQSETCAGQLLWFPWKPDGGFPLAVPLPTCKSGRPCCSGWWSERRGLKFILTCFCDDIQDDDEQLELTLHCTPGHKIPLICVAPGPDGALSELYTQILLISTFTPQ